MARAAGQDDLVPWLSSLRPASRAGQPDSRPYARSKPATPSAGTAIGAQISQICAGTTAESRCSKADQNGGYLESSLSMPRLTRTSAALTCS